MLFNQLYNDIKLFIRCHHPNNLKANRDRILSVGTYIDELK